MSLIQAQQEKWVPQATTSSLALVLLAWLWLQQLEASFSCLQRVSILQHHDPFALCVDLSLALVPIPFPWPCMYLYPLPQLHGWLCLKQNSLYFEIYLFGYVRKVLVIAHFQKREAGEKDNRTFAN